MTTDPSGEQLLVVSDLVAGYGAIEVLHGVSFGVGKGDAVAVLGANGAGKTTLLRTISGMISPKSGDIHFAGQSIVGVAPHLISRRGIGHVPEGRQILQHLTVRENLFLGARNRSTRAANLERLLDTFKVLRDKLNDPGGSLSGGQQQMLAIARALMGEPSLVLLDEPSLGLSPRLVEELTQLLIAVRAESDASFVLVEQNIALAADLTETAAVIQRGSIVRIESSRAILEDSSLLEAYLA